MPKLLLQHFETHNKEVKDESSFSQQHTQDQKVGLVLNSSYFFFYLINANLDPDQNHLLS